ncbi:MAG TPA: hypothetical protein VIW29_08825, partial [Polyangiaceae bacterium]
ACSGDLVGFQNIAGAAGRAAGAAGNASRGGNGGSPSAGQTSAAGSGMAPATGGSSGNTSTAGAGGTDAAGGSGGEGAAGDDCAPGMTMTCWETPQGTSLGDVPANVLGACKLGTRTCASDGKLGPCQGALAPASEDTCDAGDDANCNGVPNEGCSCVKGSTRPCGSDVGACQFGTQTCQDQEWGDCLGQIGPQPRDTCDAGNDANCNGLPNEGCACVIGAVANCGNCGTQQCVKGGTWGPCTDEGECAPNEVQDETESCGLCGSQAIRRKCTSDCQWADWTDYPSSSCQDQGVCEPGAVVYQTVDCGKCGLQNQQRTCTETCAWADWQDTGTCSEQRPPCAQP